ncbi:hypothetical protein [Latilactobacillus graminis]|uniref:Uncharacterized protein n=2 Tax=Latilactobacillus graminis TaxID=60519 RepID=A0AA89I4M4_9LACO|nr:hypothetical protein [Latilactobacillus graminis]KRM22319.1 hypothetical protein FC90_GL000920 [Latilactobacillus graminis DSM 20719]QFP79507.1 hypothetical protein LG542_04350 [Latilactobacillus graminis]
MLINNTFKRVPADIHKKYVLFNNKGVSAQCKLNILNGGESSALIHGVSYRINSTQMSVDALIDRSKKGHSKSENFNILDNSGELVGTLRSRMSFPIFGYMYYEFIFSGTLYTIYKVGMGKQGLKFIVYIDDKQVGLMEKELVERNGRSEYEFFMVDKKAEVVSFLFLVYYDASYNVQGEVLSNTKEVTYEFTIHKELRNKYNPKFKEQHNGKKY